MIFTYLHHLPFLHPSLKHQRPAAGHMPRLSHAMPSLAQLARTDASRPRGRAVCRALPRKGRFEAPMPAQSTMGPPLSVVTMTTSQGPREARRVVARPMRRDAKRFRYWTRTPTSYDARSAPFVASDRSVRSDALCSVRSVLLLLRLDGVHELVPNVSAATNGAFWASLRMEQGRY